MTKLSQKEFQWKIEEILKDEYLNMLARDYNSENIAYGIVEKNQNLISEKYKNNENCEDVAKFLFENIDEETKKEIESYPHKILNPKIGDLVMATNGIPKTDVVYALGKIVKITRTVTDGDVYWLEGSYTYFTTIIQPNKQYKHLNTQDWDNYIELGSKYIEGEFDKGFTYNTMDKEKLKEKFNEIYETLRNKENK